MTNAFEPDRELPAAPSEADADLAEFERFEGLEANMEKTANYGAVSILLSFAGFVTYDRARDPGGKLLLAACFVCAAATLAGIALFLWTLSLKYASIPDAGETQAELNQRNRRTNDRKAVRTKLAHRIWAVSSVLSLTIQVAIRIHAFDPRDW